MIDSGSRCFSDSGKIRARLKWFGRSEVNSRFSSSSGERRLAKTPRPRWPKSAFAIDSNHTLTQIGGQHAVRWMQDMSDEQEGTDSEDAVGGALSAVVDTLGD